MTVFLVGKDRAFAEMDVKILVDGVYIGRGELRKGEDSAELVYFWNRGTVRRQTLASSETHRACNIKMIIFKFANNGHSHILTNYHHGVFTMGVKV